MHGLRHWWWIVALSTVVALVVGAFAMREEHFATSFRSTVVIPGDTEDTGSAERPELMILDDLGPLIESQAYAQMVLDAIPADERGSLTVAAVQESLSGSRYSRVATVDVSTASADQTTHIAVAAEAVLPEAVNAYLVAPGAEQASVQMIDPPGEPVSDWRDRLVVLVAACFGGFAAGIGIVAILLLLQPRSQPTGELK